MKVKDDRVVLVLAADGDELLHSVDINIGLFVNALKRIDEVGKIIVVSLCDVEDRCSGNDDERDRDHDLEHSDKHPGAGLFRRFVSGLAPVCEMDTDVTYAKYQ